jgi:hypothetical protein
MSSKRDKAAPLVNEVCLYALLGNIQDVDGLGGDRAEMAAVRRDAVTQDTDRPDGAPMREQILGGLFMAGDAFGDVAVPELAAAVQATVTDLLTDPAARA